ncbi:MAG: sigma-70 family RNA polymerase sigma factor [Bacteroidetes bacterium]|nr:sigma-70 family RNA polymerase sigma factor [Bacteroidota bacterium]
MTDYSDSELLKLFREGDNPNYAFNLLMRRYQQKVYYHIRRIVIDHDDANDVVQNTFIKAWSGLTNFREDSQFFTWLYRIATNESLTFLKKKRTAFFIPIINVEKILAEKLESDSLISGDEIQLKLQKAILSLPEKQRLVFNMKYYDEMKYEEMSEVLGTSVGALKASYHHAVKKIEKFVKTH